MKLMCVMLGAALIIVPATANAGTETYGWEDGVGTILGSFGNLVDDTNVSGAQSGSDGSAGGTYGPSGPNSGTYYLHVAEEPHSGTPQAYIAWITGLTDGDVIDADFFGYDVTAGASASLRIWGHYTTSGDITDYQGSAGGNSTYTAGTGWDNVGHSWTFDSDAGTRDALVVEARLYSTLSTDPDARTDYWIDDVTVTAPDTAAIHFAPEPATLALLGFGGLLLLRRRR
jgi:hypothetical protein